MRNLFSFSLLVCFSFFSFLAQAATETFIREYTYNASENDSKVSARKAALQQLQVMVIQEVGVQVRSSFEVEDHVTNDELSRDVQAHYGTYAKALTKSVILEEKWNGESFYIKAEIFVDTDQVGQQLQRMAKPPAVAAKDPCKLKEEQAFDLIKNSHRKEKVEALVELALSNPIDEGCNAWQLSVMNQFRLMDLDDDRYRAYIFEQAKKESTSFQGDLLIRVLQYALRIKALTEEEWQMVVDILPGTDRSTAYSLVSLLINYAQIDDAEGLSKYSLESNNRKQTQDALKEKLDTLFELAKDDRLGMDDKLSPSEYAMRVLTQLPNKNFLLTPDYYQKMKSVMTADDHRKLIKPFSSALTKRLDDPSLQLFLSYFEQLESDKNVARTMHGLIQRLDREARKQENDFQRVALVNLMAVDKVKMSEILLAMTTNQREKDLWFIRFDLPNSPACRVEACAAMLFDQDKRTQQQAAEYLEAYGDRAKPAEDLVIKKLTRVRALTKFEEPRYITSNLIQVLGNINASSTAAYELMVWGLGGITKEVQDVSVRVMTRVGAKALPVMIEAYPKASQSAQRRIINVIGTFKTKQSDAQIFLASITPANEYIRFAIEDAQISLVPQ
ncbi:hypothetical protein [Litoribrevibacter albus]|uniref:HEAT repeat domain-containing protein n=1 Tax=Litoribrevibacter albus TaxID=1473156 RepID=A0AA37W4T8_9GAMM|nr:hypothetical protein [Litoribrevibacter albus]GLQ30447.1 hypothetical protein GCM10007876_09250 [Litoribrevibacter albus]